MQLSVQANFKDALAMLNQYPGQVRAAAANALNKVGAKAKTAMYKRIRERRPGFEGSASEIKNNIKIKRATADHLTVSVQTSGYQISMSHYKHTVNTSGVYVTITGNQKLVGKYGNKAFVTTGIAGKPSYNPSTGSFDFSASPIMVRRTSKRLPIERMFGPALQSAVTAGGWEAAVLTPMMAQDWANYFTSQLQWRVARLTKA